MLEKSRRKPNPHNRVDEHVETAVVELAVEQPALGQLRASNELRKREIFVSPTGVRGIWQRHGLETFKKRLARLEEKGARSIQVGLSHMTNLRQKWHVVTGPGNGPVEHPVGEVLPMTGLEVAA